jgi:hypothetical protein
MFELELNNTKWGGNNLTSSFVLVNFFLLLFTAPRHALETNVITAEQKQNMARIPQFYESVIASALRIDEPWHYTFRSNDNRGNVTYNETLRRVRELLLPWKSSTHFYVSVYVLARV